jgi:hypothetical protein
VVLLVAFSSGRYKRACAHETTREGAPSHTHGCSCGDQQRYNECVGLAAARLTDDLAARREQLALDGVACSPAKGAGSSEAPLTAASTPAASTAAACSSIEPSCATAEPAGSAAGHAVTAFDAGRSDSH